MANNGKEYELFVARLQQALLNAENITEEKNLKIEVDKKILDNCGIERQFDIYWEYELADITYKTVIECKDYNSNVSIEKIDALVGKTRDIPGLKLVFATKKGYQSGAKLKAEQNMIDLLIVREQNISDWTSLDGTPLIQKVCINMCLSMPAHIHQFRPTLDLDWIKKNTNVDTSKPLNLSGLNNEIFIEDIDRCYKYSLHELANRLVPLGVENYGRFEKTEKFENAFIHYKNIKYKIISYTVEYSIMKPCEEHIEIDFSKELIGVVEYLQKGIKQSIFKDKIIRMPIEQSCTRS